MSSFTISPATQLYGLRDVFYSLPFLVLAVSVARFSQMPLGVIVLLFSPLIVPALVMHGAY